VHGTGKPSSAAARRAFRRAFSALSSNSAAHPRKREIAQSRVLLISSELQLAAFNLDLLVILDIGSYGIRSKSERILLHDSGKATRAGRATMQLEARRKSGERRHAQSVQHLGSRTPRATYLLKATRS
jgi:hypothetical protein